MIPLLAPRAFCDWTADTFHVYVKSLYVAPEVKEPPADYSARLNKKGNPVITVRREPKFLTSAEVTLIAEDLSIPLQTLWLRILKGKKIEIKVPRKETK